MSFRFALALLRFSFFDFARSPFFTLHFARICLHFSALLFPILTVIHSQYSCLVCLYLLFTIPVSLLYLVPADMRCKCQHRSVVFTGYASVWFSLHQSKLAEAEHGQHALLNWWCLLGKTFGFAHKWVPDQFLVNIAQMLQTQKGLRYLRIRQFAHIFPSSCSHSVLAAYFWWNKSAISHQSFSAEQISHILNMYNSVLTRSIGPKVGFSITVLSFLLFSIVQIYLYLHKLWSTLYSLCKMKIEWLLFKFFLLLLFPLTSKKVSITAKGIFLFCFCKQDSVVMQYVDEGELNKTWNSAMTCKMHERKNTEVSREPVRSRWTVKRSGRARINLLW